MAPSRHDWKIVDWDVKPQHNQPTYPTSIYLPFSNSTPVKPPLPFTLPILPSPPLPSPILPYSIPLHFTILSSSLPPPFPFPPLAALPPRLTTLLHSTLPYLTLPYHTLPSLLPYPIPTISSPLLSSYSAPPDSTLPYPTLPTLIPTPYLAYPALLSSTLLPSPLPYPSQQSLHSTSKAKRLGPKRIGVETSRAESACCWNVKGRNILMPKHLGAETS